jgi:GT2 family glycosyltransferase
MGTAFQYAYGNRELECGLIDMKEPLVYILILNWKSAQNTLECVQSLKSMDYSNFKIVVLDNGSPDDSDVVLRTSTKDYHYIQTGKNLGYAGGNNIGIRHAVEKGAEFVWIINPDVRVDKASLTIMTQAMASDPSIGICGPRIEDYMHNKVFTFDGSDYHQEKFEAVKNFVNQADSPAPDIRYVSDLLGCSILIRSSVIKKIGLLREDFFLYLEETDFNFRVQKDGWKVAVCTKTINRHLRNGDTNDFLYRRNELLLARIHKRQIGTAVLYAMGMERVPEYFKKGNIKGALWHLVRPKFRSLIAGIFKPIKPIPKI